MNFRSIAVLLLFLGLAHGIDNGLGRTPPSKSLVLPCTSVIPSGADVSGLEVVELLSQGGDPREDDGRGKRNGQQVARRVAPRIGLRELRS